MLTISYGSRDANQLIRIDRKKISSGTQGRPVYAKVKILIYIVLAEAQIETGCHFPLFSFIMFGRRVHLVKAIAFG